MSATPFLSYAQNGEDVVLWRALRAVPRGTYVDVGAAHPTELSVTKALYERGWRGVDVEPVDAFADLLERDRPGDVVIRAMAGSAPGTGTLHLIAGTGLSTQDEALSRGHAAEGYAVTPVERPLRRVDDIVDEHLQGRDLHVLKIDVEGAEGDVLKGVDFSRVRPWIVVAEATRPLSDQPSHGSWEPDLLAAGYRFCLFDGLSRWYVAEEHPELAPALSYPACPLDDWLPVGLVELREHAGALEQEALSWRAQALARAAELSQLHRTGADASAQAALAENRLLHDEVAWLRGLNADLDAQLRAIGRTLSWRVTRPLRVAKGLQGRRAAARP